MVATRPEVQTEVLMLVHATELRYCITLSADQVHFPLQACFMVMVSTAGPDQPQRRAILVGRRSQHT